MSKNPFAPSDAEILAADRVSVESAAAYIDADPQFLRLGLQQKTLPFGAAVQHPGGRWTYNISPGLLVAYKRGTLAVTVISA